MLRTSPQREEYLRKKRKRKLMRYTVAFFSLVFLVAILSYVSHRPEIRISNVILEGGVLVTEEEVESVALQYMRGSHFWLFPRNNALWYPKRSLKAHLLDTFKRIDTINIKRDGFKTVVVKITERKHFALWCGGTPAPGVFEDGSLREEECHFLDQNSTVFAEAPVFSGDAYFKYYGLLDESPIGKEYITPLKFKEISDFVESAKILGVRPIYLYAKGNDEFSLYLLGGGEIYFDTKEPLAKVISNLETLLLTPELATTSAGGLPVEYIDLRFGNKLFYKLKAN